MKLLKLADKFEGGKFEGKAVSVVINKGESNYLKWVLARNKQIRLHGEVIKFVQSKSQLNFNQKFLETLELINSPLAKKLLYLNNRKRLNTIFTNVKAYKTKLDTIVYDVPFGNKNNEIKVGRFVRKLFHMNEIQGFGDTDIEKFVTDFYSKISEVPKDYYFKIVKGEDIRTYYDEANYHSRQGTLGKSCERYANHAYKKELYVVNPEVEMLVLFNRETNKVTGRAILWRKANLDDYRGFKFKGTFMDRIYVNNSKDTQLFLDYAEKHKFARKRVQSYDYKTCFVVNGKEYTRTQCSVTLTNTNVNRPYLDTVSYEHGNEYKKMYNGN
ncbi:MAG: hypothetical protein SLAVMIC_00213 [uncultured marine phage]|uniref:Uncharacterized protein n=1 Tax=uncultured marine phage TaxID=707152 RepID=A0A8D9C8J2_9VIRU|nr:MAG: hypothetical protein SLAVMIC_00213 [uncultured marine phage]